MDGVEISVIGRDVASSNQAAQEMRRRLIARGLPADKVAIRKDSDETMDMGAILDIAKFALSSTSVVVEIATIALAVYEIAFRDKPTLRFKTAKGEFTLKPGEIEVDKLRLILSEAFDASVQQHQQQQ